MSFRERLKKLYNSFPGETLRYIFIGGCTTLVSVGVLALLTKVLHWEDNLSNVISIVTAVVFAYAANKLFVFRSHTDGAAALIAEVLKFFGGRAATMLIEVFGVAFFMSALGQDVLVAKIETQVIVVMGNYLISKFIVFRNNRP